MINMITQLMSIVFNPIIEKITITYQTLVTQMGQIADVLEESIDPQILLKQYIESRNIMISNKNHNDDNLIHKIRYNIGGK